MKINVVLPSRGLVFSRTMDSVFRNLRGMESSLFMAHDLPIPECFNTPMEEALGEYCDYVWFVEEDMLLPDFTLAKMIYMDCNVVSVDYADKRTGRPFLQKDGHGHVLYTGVGCMLVKRDVFNHLERPFFKEALLKLNDDGSTEEIIGAKTEGLVYGTQDVYFCNKLLEAGYEIDVLNDADIGHLTVLTFGENNKNDGSHKITAIYIKKNE